MTEQELAGQIEVLSQQTVTLEVQARRERAEQHNTTSPETLKAIRATKAARRELIDALEAVHQAAPAE